MTPKRQFELNGLSEVRPFSSSRSMICEALTRGALQGDESASAVINAQGNTVAVAEVEFGQAAVQMVFAAMLPQRPGPRGAKTVPPGHDTVRRRSCVNLNAGRLLPTRS